MLLKLLKTPLGRLRIIAFLEGLSLLVLLLIAMPMKYWGGDDSLVKSVGMVHGLLFVLYIVLVIQVAVELKWKFGKTIISLAASVVPFGTFVADKRIFIPAQSGAEGASAGKADIAELLANGAVILDVRNQNEWESGHISGAVHLPMDQLSNHGEFKWDKDQPIVTYCALGIRSKQAASELRAMGYTQVYSGGPMSAVKKKMQ